MGLNTANKLTFLITLAIVETTMKKPLKIKLRSNDKVTFAELLRAEDYTVLVLTEMGHLYRVITKLGSESIEEIWVEQDGD